MTDLKFTTFNKLSSTNKYLKDNIASFDDWQAVRAIEQTAGYGRYKREWKAISDRDLTFSIIIPTKNINPDSIPNLTQVVAVAISKVIESMGVNVIIKWPNDILIDDLKIGGILLEGVSTRSSFRIVAGVGLNVNSFQREINGRSVNTLNSVLNTEINIDWLYRTISLEIKSAVDEFVVHGFLPFKLFLEHRLAFKNKIKEISVGNKKRLFRIIGLDNSGELIVEDEDKKIEKLISGEVSFSDI